ncbi:MFS general substrate transporter, partial [Morchella conica CCBAS932]
MSYQHTVPLLAVEANEDDEIAHDNNDTGVHDNNNIPASWLTLPNKVQLTLLALCRFVTAMSQTSVLSYLYYFLGSLDTSQSPGDLARRAGYLASAFASCMFLTGWFWGRMADSIGRKKVVLTGLTATAVACLVFGFSESYSGLIVARCLAGLMDGNIAVLRTMITETVADKKYHSRAFIIPPLGFNLGAVIGPLLGGMLANPTSETSPASKLFGPGTFWGGKDGVAWMLRWKYALPNVVSAVLIAIVVAMCFFFLEETLETQKRETDAGPSIRKWLKSFFPSKYQAVPSSDTGLETTSLLHSHSPSPSPPPKAPTLHKIWTRNVKLTVLSSALLPLHMATFLHLWAVFLSAPRSTTAPHLPIKFTGGLGLSPATIGLVLSLFGMFGIAVQVIAYPPIAQHLGILTVYRWSLAIFPLAYLLIPYLTLLPPGALMWTGVAAVMVLMVPARTFSLPSSVILITRAAPSSVVLGRVHGVAASLASLSKAAGPAVAGSLFAVGMKAGVVGV